MIDAQGRLSNAQAITQDGASTNYYDFGAAVDAGIGKSIPLNCSVTEAFSVLTHLDIQIQSDDNTSFSSPTVIFSSSFGLAALTAGAQLTLPSIAGRCERYLRANYDVVGSAPTTGTINLSLGDKAQQNRPSVIPDGIA